MQLSIFIIQVFLNEEIVGKDIYDFFEKMG